MKKPPQFLLILKSTWNMCPNALEEAIVDLEKRESGLRHYSGHLYVAAKMKEIMTIAIVIIFRYRRCCRGMGSLIDGKAQDL